MKKFFIMFIVSILLVSVVSASELDNWNVHIFGINVRDFEDKDPLPLIIGAISMICVHEAGHIIIGRMGGMDTSMRWQDGGPIVWADDGFIEASRREKGFYHAGGFIAQTLVGGVLTAIPTTRHSDFTVGFNAAATVESFGYAFRESSAESGNDCKNLDKQGYNGDAIAIGSSAITGSFLHYNLGD